MDVVTVKEEGGQPQWTARERRTFRKELEELFGIGLDRTLINFERVETKPDESPSSPKIHLSYHPSLLHSLPKLNKILPASSHVFFLLFHLNSPPTAISFAF
jgi:hypothetical protein